jgi:LAO/AO transport system kinase
MVLPSHHRLSQPPSAPLSLYSSRMRSLVSIPALTEGTREIADKLLSPGTDPLLRRHALSRAVTLLESTAPHKADQAEGLLALLLRERAAESERCLRIGIAGPPGSGKSTLIEALGRYLLDPASAPASSTSDGHASKIWFPQHLAILCIDPSSHRTGGSILGDKTRMTHLAVHPRAFVRPTPSAGHLGGLAAATDQVIRLYGAAGYDLTLIETVGLGQSEVEVAESVDLTILLVPPAGGDGLQGVKKGILEIADVVVVTKADDDLMPAAQRTAADYQGALQFVGCRGERPPPVLLASSRTGSGLEKLWETVWELRNQRQSSGVLEERRRQQRHYWMWKSLQMLVELKTRSDPALAAVADELKIELDRGHLSPRLAATELLRVLSEQS